MDTDKIKLFVPDFDSHLVTLVLELEHLRRLQVSSTTHPIVFLQLKRLFHILESVGSARIEGNNTTVAEYLEMQANDAGSTQDNEKLREIQNIEAALQYIEKIGAERPINECFLREVHQLVVDGLSWNPGGEGDENAGNYRQYSVRISGSDHTPPDAILIPQLMKDLVQFINRQDDPQFDLIKIAQAHHRFVWIHPFGNGNGRTVRLFTYALLIRAGFKVDIAGRIINPTAVFCSNRDDYYRHLSEADQGTKAGMERWCTYVLSGLRSEISKVNQLSNYEYLSGSILQPAIEDAFANGRIGQETAKVLEIVAKNQVVMNRDIKSAYGDVSQSTVSRKIKELIDEEVLMPEGDNGRKYILCFSNKYLMPSIVKRLSVEGFLPDSIL